MTEYEELAEEYRKKGFNCAQCVLASCEELTGLDTDTALAVAAGFGGGLRSGEVCGALSGAVMALGMIYPYNRPGDIAAKVVIAEMAEESCRRFENEFGHKSCRDLLEMVGSKDRCGEFVAFSANLVAELSEEE